MAHIHTEPGQHDTTISIHLIRLDFDEPKIMLHLHRKIGLYTQFGGHVELHETPWQSAAHELKEETGYDIDQVQVLQPKDRMRILGGATLHPYPVAQATVGYPGQDHFHTDSIYALTASEEPRDAPEDGESTDIRLFTRNEIAQLGSDKIDSFTKDVALFVFDECLKTWRPTPTSEFKL